MPRFLIEVPHKKEKRECERAVETFRRTGSHFLANAEWGCLDDVHKAWIIVELESKKEALFIVPPVFREKAKVITLEKFALDDLDESLEKFHK